MILAYNTIDVSDDVVVALHGLRCLTGLDLSNNRLTRVPVAPEVWHVVQRATCAQLPAQFSDHHRGVLPLYERTQSMPALTSLNVRNNDIRRVPFEMGLATQLRALLLDGNPQKTVRAQRGVGLGARVITVAGNPAD